MKLTSNIDLKNKCIAVKECKNYSRDLSRSQIAGLARNGGH